jgi:hypothetical protein
VSGCPIAGCQQQHMQKLHILMLKHACSFAISFLAIFHVFCFPVSFLVIFPVFCSLGPPCVSGVLAPLGRRWRLRVAWESWGVAVELTQGQRGEELRAKLMCKACLRCVHESDIKLMCKACLRCVHLCLYVC